MSTPLPPEQQAAYGAIIDSILATADLTTISAKAIRRGLQEQVDYDLTPQKSAITDLIMVHFDKAQQRDQSAINVAPEPAPLTNGHVKHEFDTVVDAVRIEKELSPTTSKKRKAIQEAELDENSDELSSARDTPPAKKAKKTPKVESDEQMAKRMQAELNRQAGRATRGGGTMKKKAVIKKEKKVKKKSAAKVHSDDDSAVEGASNEKPEREKKGGFHKLLVLSEPLQALLGESQLSRPEVVKRIWAYVRERDLQQPDDKRNIVCDDALRAVFKSEKVHMFTMNKILATQLWPVEEAA